MDHEGNLCILVFFPLPFFLPCPSLPPSSFLSLSFFLFLYTFKIFHLEKLSMFIILTYNWLRISYNGLYIPMFGKLMGFRGSNKWNTFSTHSLEGIWGSERKVVFIGSLDQGLFAKSRNHSGWFQQPFK